MPQQKIGLVKALHLPGQTQEIIIANEIAE